MQIRNDNKVKSASKPKISKEPQIKEKQVEDIKKDLTQGDLPIKDETPLKEVLKESSDIDEEKKEKAVMPSTELLDRALDDGSSLSESELNQIAELLEAKLEEFGIEIRDRLYISENCPLILPSHVKIDQVRDKDEFIGTTGRGIGPAYEDKVGRRAIRFGDLKDEDLLRKKVSRLIKIHNKLLEHFYDAEPFSEEEILNNLLSFKNFAEAFSVNTTDLLISWSEEGKEVLFEGAQGTFLDIDHGTYPYVTSSSTTIGGVSSGLGIGPKHINNVIGIVKAYATRVGEGPFITELFDEDGEEIAKRGNEFGATTGRPRRCGWLDLVALKKAIL